MSRRGDTRQKRGQSNSPVPQKEPRVSGKCVKMLLNVSAGYCGIAHCFNCQVNVQADAMGILFIEFHHYIGIYT